MHKDSHEKKRRHSLYILLILVGLAIAAGRIAVVTSREGDTAFLSANDRSRWCTVASLVEDGTYEIDRLIDIRGEKQNRRPWYTIDMVRHRGKDGELHYYSSKPPLFSTMVAGVYYGVRAISGLTLTEQPIYVTRVILALVNLPLLAIFYVSIIFSIDRICRSNWARHSLSFATVIGTLVFPFAMTLSNHLVAAASTAVVMWVYLYVGEKLDDTVHSTMTKVPNRLYFIAGLAAAFTAANELPALSMLVLWFVLFVWLDYRCVFAFSAGVVIVAGAFFGTNLIAHDSFRPPYAHRGEGASVGQFQDDSSTLSIRLVSEKMVELNLIRSDQSIEIKASDEPGRWLVQTQDSRLYSLKKRTGGMWSLAVWDDWYEYPGSYWKEGRRRGVDQGEASRLTYFLNMTVGHYGIFSLTPIWLIVPIGFFQGVRTGPKDYQRFVIAVLIASVVCIAFYVARPMIDRNYGGVSCCFRWVLWFTPLWLLVITPVVERYGETRQNRVFFMVLLSMSVFSVSTALNSPWQSPWIYKFWSFLGWIGG